MVRERAGRGTQPGQRLRRQSARRWRPRCQGKRPVRHRLWRTGAWGLRPDYCGFSSHAADVRKRPDGKKPVPAAAGGVSAVSSALVRVGPKGSGPSLPCWFRFSPPGRCWRCRPPLCKTATARCGVPHRLGCRRSRTRPRGAASRSGWALVLVEAVAGRARLDPWRTVRVGDGPSSFQAGKTGKNRKLH